MPKVKLNTRITEFIGRNILWGVMVIVLALFYIHNGFAYERTMHEISIAKAELQDKEYTFTSEQKKLNSIGVRSNVKQKLAAAASDLEDSKEPNVRIE